MPADSNPLAFMPFLHARAQFVDHAGHFVSGDPRICNAGEKTFLRDHIAVTDATSLHLNPHMSRARLRYFALHDFKVRSCLSTHVRNYGDVFRSGCRSQPLDGDLGQKGMKIPASEGPFEG